MSTSLNLKFLNLLFPFDRSSHYSPKLSERSRLAPPPEINAKEKRVRAQTQPLVSVVVTALLDARCGFSGRIVVFVIQVIIEGDDGADEFSKLHKISCDDVNAALPGSLRSDPLHHTW